MKKISLLICVFTVFFTAKNYSAADTVTYRTNPNYIHEMSLYDIYKTKQADIVMLGNSITHGVKWNELLGREKVIERGIPSDNLEGFISRLDYIYKLKPKVCFIMGGINDIYNWQPIEKIYTNYTRIIKELKAHNIKVVIQSTLFVASKYQSSADRNIQVENLNKLLSDYAKKNGIEFIDLNSKLSKNKFLQNDVTLDGLHLNAKGFRIWGREVESILSKLGL
jgi:Lysophospholipase L1 and related esterases